MYDRLSVKRYTDIGGCNGHRQVMKSYCPSYVDPIVLLALPLVRYEDDSNDMLRLATLVEHAETVRGLTGLETCCLDRPYDQCYLIGDADA